MIDTAVQLLIFLALGVVVGLFNYTALWITVRRLPKTRKPEILSMGSFYIRTIIVLAVLFLTTSMHWEKIVFFFIGFFIVRAVFIFFFKMPSTKKLASNCKGRMIA
jgi:F1F0 ATPase subunit 2